MQKELIVGETVIGQLNGKYRGIYRRFNIVYGNVADVVVNNKTLHLTEPEYRKMLNEFLNSNSGAEYRKPSEEEIVSAMKMILNEEAKISNQKEESAEQERKEKAERDKQEAIQREQEQKALKQRELSAIENTNELKKLELLENEKKLKITKIILAFLVAFNFLQLLTIVYLLFLK